MREACAHPASGWCWVNAPEGLFLRSIWAIDDDDAWAVGRAYAALHWDGKQWETVRVPTDVELNAVWASSANDVWFVGQKGEVLRFDGRSWSRFVLEQGPYLWSISGTAADDVWASGVGAYHWDGKAWSRVPGLDDWIGSIRATGHAQAIAVAVQPFGCAWVTPSGATHTDCGSLNQEGAAFGNADDLWVAGTPDTSADFEPGLVSHWDGQQWTRVLELWKVPTMHSIFGLRPDDLWINGRWHFDGASWTDVNPDMELIGIHGAGRTVWGVDTRGVWRLQAGKWSSDLTVSTETQLLQVDARGRPVAWRDRRFMRWDGTAWTALTGPIDVPGYGAFGSEQAGFWFRPYDGTLWRWTGSEWVQTDPGAYTTALLVSAADDVLAVGPNAARRWNGSTWTELPSPFGADLITGFYVDPSGAAWAMGKADANPQDGWMGPGKASLWRRDATGWRHVYEGGEGRVLSGFGGSGDDVWFSVAEPGSDGWYCALLHWTGSRFEVGPSFKAQTELLFNTMAGSGGDDIWLSEVGGYGASLVHFDGRSWSLVDAPKPAVFGIVGAPGVGTYLTTGWGAILFRERSRMPAVPSR